MTQEGHLIFGLVLGYLEGMGLPVFKSEVVGSSLRITPESPNTRVIVRCSHDSVSVEVTDHRSETFFALPPRVSYTMVDLADPTSDNSIIGTLAEAVAKGLRFSALPYRGW